MFDIGEKVISLREIRTEDIEAEYSPLVSLTRHKTYSRRVKREWYVGYNCLFLKKENHARTLTFPRKCVPLQVIIVSVLWLFKTMCLKALRSFLNRYLSIQQ